MSRPDPLGRLGAGLAHRLAAGTTRRSLLAGIGAALLGLASPARAARRPRVRGTEPVGGWFGFCGHYWTTGSCPSPHRLPRVDHLGYPVRPEDGLPVDNLGRLIGAGGLPADESGAPLIGPDGEPLPRAPRTRVCEDWVPERHGVDAVTQASWYRCCDGQVRRLVDCCSTSRTRVNGDAALRGYCRPGRYVYCVVYVDTGVPC